MRKVRNSKMENIERERERGMVNSREVLLLARCDLAFRSRWNYII